jgi:hypothetical protein
LTGTSRGRSIPPVAGSRREPRFVPPFQERRPLFCFARTYRTELEQGLFYCENCCAPRRFVARRERLWLTLFLLAPLFPLSRLREVVVCRGCTIERPLEALEKRRLTEPKAAILAARFMAVTALPAMVTTNGHLDEKKLRAARPFYFIASDHLLSMDEMRVVVVSNPDDPRKLRRYMSSLREMIAIDPSQAHILLRWLVEIAEADGAIDDAEWALIDSASDAIGVTREQLEVILTEPLERVNVFDGSPM